MDANQTRFHLVLCEDWRDVRDGEGRPVPTTPDDPCDLVYEDGRLALNRSVSVIRARPGDAVADPALRQGAVRDRLGNLYVVDGAGVRLRVCTQRGDEVGDWFWLDPGGAALSGVAITADDLLVVGRPGEGDLVIFDLVAGGTPVSVPGPVGFAPYDLAAAGADVVVLDRAARRVYRLTLVIPPAPAPVLPGLDVPPVPTPSGFRVCELARGTLVAALDVGFSLDPAVDPVGIEWHPGGAVLVLDSAFGVRLYVNGIEGTSEPFSGMRLEPATAVVGHDLVRVPRAKGDVLFVVDAQGNQAFSFDLVTVGGAPRLDHRAELIPLRHYRGRSLCAGDGDGWYEADGRWVPLVSMNRPRFRTLAAAVLPVVGAGTDPLQGWDGGTRGCVWHRVLLDGCFPPGSRIDVYSRSTDDRARFDDPSWGWRREPPLVARRDGSELPFDHRGLTTMELLLQAAVGRFLQLRLEIVSDGRASPHIEALRVYFPRFSYLDHYLPAAWREDPTSADFLARYLANPEGIFTTIEDRVAQAHHLFNPALTSPDFLPWLAGWFQATLEDAWSEEKRRFFLANTTTFFHWRGTRRGVLAAVRMVLHDCVSLDIFERLPDGITLLEGFVERPQVGQDAPTAPGAATDPAGRWAPEFGAGLLVARWDSFWSAWRAGLADPASEPATLPFPVSAPDATRAAMWADFCATRLRFTPAATVADRPALLAWLARRGLSTSIFGGALSAAASGPLFLSLPTSPDGATAWFRFESLLRPIREHAHHFTVVLPMPAHDVVAADPGYAERLRSVVRRAVEREKPAHTTFDVIYSDRQFRPGAVRLGFDTVLAPVDRDPAPAFLLDQDALAEAHLGTPFPMSPPRTDGGFVPPTPLPEPT